jgi:hypothetical protein
MGSYIPTSCTLIVEMHMTCDFSAVGLSFFVVGSKQYERSKILFDFLGWFKKGLPLATIPFDCCCWFEYCLQLLFGIRSIIIAA